MGQSNCQKVPKNAKKSQNKFFLFSTVSKLLSEVQAWSVKWMWPKSATRLGKKSLKWQKIAKLAKIGQNGKNLPKWWKIIKVAKSRQMAKSPQISLQRVPDGSRSQTAWARTTRGTYAWAPYAFAALGQELVESNFMTKLDSHCMSWTWTRFGLSRPILDISGVWNGQK